MLSTFKSTNPDLTLVIQALEQFQGFSKNIQACAIALHAQELGINSLHYYAIAQARTQGFAHLAGLGGES
jgi:hypothetical protein